MTGNFTESSSQGWLGKLGSSFVGALIGLMLFLASFPLEVWNEGRAVAAMKALKEGAKTVLTVDITAIKPDNAGKLVYISGPAKTNEVLTDETFGVGTNAMRLRRDVQMYQWQQSESSQTSKKLGGGSETTTTYSYKKTWADRSIDSSGFKHPEGHDNPGQLPYATKQFTASDVRVGAFKLNSEAIDKLDQYSDLTIDKHADKVDGKPAALIDHQVIYLGHDNAAPQVGDLEVSYKYLPLGPVSVIARQAGDGLEPYRTSNGREIELARCGTFSSAEMFKQAEEENKLITWLVRGGGFLMMWIGLCLLGGPLSALGDVIPFLGDLIGGGIGLIALAASLVLSALTIAVAWIAFRPLLAIGIILGAIAAAAGLLKLRGPGKKQ